MKKDRKIEITNSVVQDLQEYKYMYITDLTGLNVEQTNALRRMCFRRNIKLRMVKNSLLKRALEEINVDYSELYPVLHGTSSIMLCDNGNAPAKLIKEFRGKKAIPAIKAAFVEEVAFIGDDQLETLISLKSREELIGDVIGLLQSPAKNVISALQANGGQKIAGIVKTLSEKSE
ncbi:MAG: 50S ribosomal protein L10 [Bacteroidales bacterium]|nr:50S ribosomal protein L10 [Bacteroidales bacterium]MDD4760543.1 50S ribosomal protein L10 [Bacteroidaceae bacterium]